MAYVLIVDDDEDLASATSTVLSGAGHEVKALLDTSDAIPSMQEKTPDLIILDVMFPEDSMAGFKLARTIRNESEKFKNIPILMLTAVNAKLPMGFSSDDIDNAWLPISDFVEKPVDLDVLLAKVEKLLESTSAQ
jgi:DNA-binding response OmpR family regulator